MTFQITTPVHLVCGNDDLHPALSHVFFNLGYIVATDAHSLVAISMQDLKFKEEIHVELEGYLMHKDFFKQIVGAKKQLTFRELDGQKFICVNNGTLYPLVKNRSNDLKYPDWTRVIGLEIKKGGEPVNQIGIDYNLYSNICKCLLPLVNSHCIALLLNGSQAAIHVKPTEQSLKSIGVIMPIKLEQW